MKLMVRLFAHIALFFSVFFLPWWVTLVAACLAFFLVNNFYDGILWGVVADMLYGVPVASFFGFNLFFTALFIAFFASARALRHKMRFND